MIRALDDHTLEMKLPEAQATSFVLYCLSANVGSVVDMKTVMANQANGDMGNAWLKSRTAGAGPYKLTEWSASDHVIIDVNPNAAEKPLMRRIVMRHVADPSAQLLLLQKGDVDIARELGSDQLKSIAGDKNLTITSASQGTSMYMAMNQAVPELQKVPVHQAIKWAIDYDAIAKNITPDTWSVCQAFLPDALPGALKSNPFKKDVAKAKQLLAEAGLGGGFAVNMDYISASPHAEIAQAIQADLAAVGIKVTLLPGEQKQVITKTRARQHQLALLYWGTDYFDPNSNSQAWCENPDDSDQSKLKILAWRSHFVDKELTAESQAAVRELDPEKRIGHVPHDPAAVHGPRAVRHAASAQCGCGAGQGCVGVQGRADARLHQVRADYQGVNPRLQMLAGSFASIPLTLFGLTLVTFLIGRVMPIDPVIAIAGDHAPPDVIAAVREQLGLDKPLFVQFWIYLVNLLHGDLGRSVMTSHPVTADIAQFFPATLELATTAMIIAIVVGIPLGVIAAERQGSRFDHVVRVVSLAGQSVPVFVLGLVCLLVFYVKLGIAPGTGQLDVAYEGLVPRVTGMLVLDSAIAGDWDSFWDALAHLAQPALVLAYFSMAYITRMTRAFMIESLAGEYIITARAKGLSASRILWRHAFGNIAVRLVTVLALAYAGLLEGAVITETVFSWPGLGLYLTVSLLNADMNAVLGATLVVGLVYLVLNLLADVLYRLLDPRVA